MSNSYGRQPESQGHRKIKGNEQNAISSEAPEQKYSTIKDTKKSHKYFNTEHTAKPLGKPKKTN